MPAAAFAAPAVTETPVDSVAPGAKQVKESYVSIADPLPDSVRPHPEACDSLGYLRFRSSRGPEDAKRADAVITLIPGFLAGAATFDQIARNVIRDAEKRGKHVEVWAIDRRANCLEDHHGVRGRRQGAGRRPRLPLLLGRRGGGRQAVRGLSRRHGRQVRRLVRARAHAPRLEHGHHDGAARPEAARAQARLRRPLARRPPDRRLRQLGLRRRPGDRQGRRLPPVRRPRRPRHVAGAGQRVGGCRAGRRAG